MKSEASEILERIENQLAGIIEDQNGLMPDKEFYTRLRKFLDDNMGAFMKWNTDIGELNELGIEINKRLKQV